MKIFNNPNIARALKIYGKANDASGKRVGGAELPKDQLELSAKAKEFQVALKAFKELPDIREAKVNEIKERLQQGSYSVSGQEIAEKIFESILIDKKI
jgi:negative regulator of flagellin synthesis FlgM